MDGRQPLPWGGKGGSGKSSPLLPREAQREFQAQEEKAGRPDGKVAVKPHQGTDQSAGLPSRLPGPLVAKTPLPPLFPQPPLPPPPEASSSKGGLPPPPSGQEPAAWLFPAPPPATAKSSRTPRSPCSVPAGRPAPGLPSPPWADGPRPCQAHLQHVVQRDVPEALPGGGEDVGGLLDFVLLVPGRLGVLGQGVLLLLAHFLKLLLGIFELPDVSGARGGNKRFPPAFPTTEPRPERDSGGGPTPFPKRFDGGLCPCGKGAQGILGASRVTRGSLPQPPEQAEQSRQSHSLHKRGPK